MPQAGTTDDGLKMVGFLAPAQKREEETLRAFRDLLEMSGFRLLYVWGKRRDTGLGGAGMK